MLLFLSSYITSVIHVAFKATNKTPHKKHHVLAFATAKQNFKLTKTQNSNIRASPSYTYRTVNRVDPDFTAHKEQLSRVMRKLDFCLCENKGADQLCSNCTADQRLCFRYTYSIFPPLPIPKVSRV